MAHTKHYSKKATTRVLRRSQNASTNRTIPVVDSAPALLVPPCHLLKTLVANPVDFAVDVQPSIVIPHPEIVDQLFAVVDWGPKNEMNRSWCGDVKEIDNEIQPG